MQEIICEREGYQSLPALFRKRGLKKVLLVCGKSFQRSSAFAFLKESDVAFCLFESFTPNPDIDEVKAGIALFEAEGCDAVLAAGGGSAIDVAKCIKLLCKVREKDYFNKEAYQDTGIFLAALPTTAGTGSESTHFAVVYRKGEKQSVAHESLLPHAAILDASLLSSLPPYQKSCSMMDALCQAIESHWSLRATEESRAFSQKAIRLILRHGESFVFDNDPAAAEKILTAANLAGRAINITTTTAPHAMSYQLTKLYSLPHGHSVSLCLGPVWEEMLSRPEGLEAAQKEFASIALAMGEATPQDALKRFRKLVEVFGFASPKARDREKELSHLVSSVNPARLSNHPAKFSAQTLRRLYERIVK